MNVPPIFPEPVEVVGNVASLRRPDVLRFVRRVCGLHSATLIATTALVLLPVPLPNSIVATGLFIGGLVGLAFTRWAIPNGVRESWLGLAVMSATLFGAAALSRVLVADGWPMALGPLGALVAASYSYTSRTDFSFTAQFLISTLFVLIASAALHYGLGVDASKVALVAVVTCVYLFYYVYDLSTMIRRRRRSELIAATIDLHRDLLNFVTYPLRVWRHWRDRLWV